MAVMLAIEPILTMLPRPAASIRRPASWQQQNRPKTRLRQVCSTASSEISSGAPQHGFAGDIAQKIDPPELAIELREHAADLLRL